MAVSAEAQVAGKAPSPTPVIERGPSKIDLINKALNPGPSNPTVPLPHPDLAISGGNETPTTGAQIYGRQEQGGGVLGLRVPIPADRKL